ncbi:hypothetical protein ATPR_2585 [Acetobacter tropicalis NBRC 101654]|uniref:Uncharacterized protein n=1 Tax=Acetobacter tropicalis NBRC 101654 TaxID=749388 RepID=F7VGT6_9PROT|nr:hypothetical protein ATPR_2585 [Acetobacter tropicalis NBRC 101654]
MEVSNQEQGVMQNEVSARNGHHHTGHTTDGEGHHEANGPVHAGMELDAALIHGEHPVKQLHTRGDRDHHGCNAEEGVHVRTSAHCEEVMHPHQEGQDHDRAGCVDHGAIAEQRLLGESRNNFREHAEGGNNKNINFRMTPCPDQVEVHHLITTTVIGEEVHAEVTVQTQQRNGNRQHREGNHDQDGSTESGPGENRHFHPGHARSAHLHDRHEEVHTCQQGANTRKLNGPDIIVYTDARAELSFRQRRVGQPATLREFTDEQGNVHQNKRNSRHPEAQVVQEREGNVASADLKRHNEVEQTGHERHRQEEDHDRSVSGEDLIVMVWRQVAGVASIGQGQLGTHHDSVRKTAEQSNERQDDVHHSQTLVINRSKPLFPEIAPLPVIGDQPQNRETDNGNAQERAYKDRNIQRDGR